MQCAFLHKSYRKLLQYQRIFPLAIHFYECKAKSHETDSNSWRHKFTLCSFPLLSQQDASGRWTFSMTTLCDIGEGRETECVSAGSTSATLLRCYDKLRPHMKESDTHEFRFTSTYKSEFKDSRPFASLSLGSLILSRAPFLSKRNQNWADSGCSRSFLKITPANELAR